jgi:hypothetical protein
MVEKSGGQFPDGNVFFPVWQEKDRIRLYLGTKRE